MSVYHYYNNVIPSKSIRTAICTNLKGNKKKYLLYACNNYLNVCAVDKDGHTSDYSKHAVFSEILELREYIPEKLVDTGKRENIKSYIFLLTRKYNLLLLQFDVKLNDFVTISQVNLQELNGLHVEEDITLLLDDRNRTILFYGYKNILKYVHLDYNDFFNLSHIYTLRLDEGLIIDIIFLKFQHRKTETVFDTSECSTRISTNGNAHGGNNNNPWKDDDENNKTVPPLQSVKRQSIDSFDKAVTKLNANDVVHRNSKDSKIDYLDMDLPNPDMKEEKNGTNQESSKCNNKSGPHVQYTTIERVKKHYADNTTMHNYGSFINSPYQRSETNGTSNVRMEKEMFESTTRMEKKMEEEKLKITNLIENIPKCADNKTAWNSITKGESSNICLDKNLSNSNKTGKKNSSHENPQKGKKKKNKSKISATICVLYDAKKKDSRSYERYIRLIRLYSMSDDKRISALSDVSTPLNPRRNNEFCDDGNAKNNVQAYHHNNNDDDDDANFRNVKNEKKEGMKYINLMYYKPIIVDSSINKLLCIAKNKLMLIGFQFISYINLEIDQDKNFFLSSELRTIRCIEHISRNKFIMADDYGDLFILTCILGSNPSSFRRRSECINDNIIDEFIFKGLPSSLGVVPSSSSSSIGGGQSLSSEISRKIENDNNGINSITLQFIGTCSRSNVVVSIFPDIIFLGSQVSDSYLLKMHNYPTYEYDDYTPVEPSTCSTFNSSYFYHRDNRGNSITGDENSNDENNNNCMLKQFHSDTKRGADEYIINNGIDYVENRSSITKKRNFLQENYPYAEEITRTNEFTYHNDRGTNSIDMQHHASTSRSNYKDGQYNNKHSDAQITNSSRQISHLCDENMYQYQSECISGKSFNDGNVEEKKRVVIESHATSIKNNPFACTHIDTYRDSQTYTAERGEDKVHNFHLRNSLKEKKKKFYIEILSVIQNMGPILDFCVIKNKNDEKEIITCNSYGRTGCISIIRNGLKTNIISKLNFSKITNMFVVKYVIHLKKKNKQKGKSTIDEKLSNNDVMQKSEINNNHEQSLLQNNISNPLVEEKGKKSLQFQVFAQLNDKKNVEIKDINLSFLNKYYFQNEKEIDVLNYANFIYFHIFIICVTYGYQTKVIGVCREEGAGESREKRDKRNLQKEYSTDSMGNVGSRCNEKKKHHHCDTVSPKVTSCENFTNDHPFNIDDRGQRKKQNEIFLCEYKNTDVDLLSNTIYFNVLKNFPYLIQVTNNHVKLLCCLSLKLVYDLKMDYIFKFCVYNDYLYIYCDNGIQIYAVEEKYLQLLYNHKCDRTITSMVVYKSLMACAFNNREVALINIDVSCLDRMRVSKSCSRGDKIPNDAIQVDMVRSEDRIRDLESIRGTDENPFVNTKKQRIFTQASSYQPALSTLVFITDVEVLELNDNVYLFIGLSNGEVESFLLCADNRNDSGTQRRVRDDTFLTSFSAGSYSKGKNLDRGASHSESGTSEERNSDAESTQMWKLFQNENGKNQVARMDGRKNGGIENTHRIRGHADNDNIFKLHKFYLKKKEEILKLLYKDDILKTGKKPAFSYKIKITDDMEKEKYVKKCKRGLIKYLSESHSNILQYFNFSKCVFTNVHDLHKACMKNEDEEIVMSSNLFNNVNIQSDTFVSMENILQGEHTKYLKDCNSEIHGKPLEESSCRTIKQTNTHTIYNNMQMPHECATNLSAYKDRDDWDKNVRLSSSHGRWKNCEKLSHFSDEIGDTNVDVENSLDELHEVASFSAQDYENDYEKDKIANVPFRRANINSHLHARDGKFGKEINLNRKKTKYFFHFFQIYGSSSEESSDSDIVNFDVFKKLDAKVEEKRRAGSPTRSSSSSHRERKLKRGRKRGREGGREGRKEGGKEERRGRNGKSGRSSSDSSSSNASGGSRNGGLRRSVEQGSDTQFPSKNILPSSNICDNSLNPYPSRRLSNLNEETTSEIHISDPFPDNGGKSIHGEEEKGEIDKMYNGIDKMRKGTIEKKERGNQAEATCIQRIVKKEENSEKDKIKELNMKQKKSYIRLKHERDSQESHDEMTKKKSKRSYNSIYDEDGKIIEHDLPEIKEVDVDGMCVREDSPLGRVEKWKNQLSRSDPSRSNPSRSDPSRSNPSRIDLRREKEHLNDIFQKKVEEQCGNIYVRENYVGSGKYSNFDENEEFSSDASICFNNLNNILFDEKKYIKRYVIRSKKILLTNKRRINVCTKGPIKFKKFLKVFSEKNKIDVNLTNVVKKYNFLFVCCDNPIIIYSNLKKKICLSKLSIKNIYQVDIFNDFNYLNPFHNFSAFKKINQNNFYFICFDGFKIFISHLNEIKKNFLQKIPFHRTVEKIAYHEDTGLLVAACPVEEKHKTNQMMKQILCFFDPFQNSFKYTYVIPSKFSVSSICIYEIQKKSNTNKVYKTNETTQVNTFICVGTANNNERITEPSSGHIYIFIAKKMINLFEIKHIYTYNVNCGGITHLKQFHEKLIAAVNNTVVIFDISNFLTNMEKYINNSGKTMKTENKDDVVEVASFTPSSWIMSLDVLENYIIVGDIMTSVTLLSYDFEKALLTEVCRDYSNVWCTSVCALSKNHFLVSDMESNFLVLQKSNVRYNDEDSFKLSMVSQFNHGSVVNKMFPVSLTNLFDEEENRSGILQKEKSILCASSEGSISAIIPFSNFANFKRTLCIEIALNDNVSSIGNLSHSSYREYKVNSLSKSCKGVIDGELFKMFFYMPFEKQFKTYIYAKWIARKLNCRLGNFERFMLDIENLCTLM
ncbi:hypothetical protein, conserved [Plasmodium gonderi]|uniref:Uncharacterized protein n=1 Tax=Plasmodium gonderi TaxID=77519 RepID=A0A1Y1JDT3_PLAGO|nr:hypothetical protein, conserved [Plasmodium gonderi]GAW80646.1 hypothetical protein, conserved [Plasmodium gonderi]